MQYNNNCLCQNIKTLQECEEMSGWDRESCIVYNDVNDSYGFWYDCDDFYYSGWKLTINYCPICGRKLNANRKRIFRLDI